MGLYNFRGNFISEDAVAQTVMQSGLCPVNSTQTINSSGQVTGATYTYADGSSITAAFTYADTSAKDYSSASYSLNAVGGGGSTPTATGYTLTTPAGDLTLNTAVTFTVTATGGAFASGTTITPSVTGVTGTFSPTSLSGAGSFTFTPTTAGTAVVSTTNNQNLPNPASIGRTVVAGAPPAATGYTFTAPAGDLTVNTPVTLTLAATGGNFASGTIITPTVSGVTGTFSPATLADNGACTFTPTSTGTATISFTNNQSLPNAVNIVRTVSAAAGFALQYASFSPDVTVNTATNVLTLPSVNNAMAVSQAIPIASFTSVRYLATDPARMRGVFVGVYKDAALSTAFIDGSGLRTQVGSGQLNARAFNDGSTGYTGVAMQNQPIPNNTLVRILKSGDDALIQTSPDDITYTTVNTRVGAFAGMTSVYVKVGRYGSGDGQGNELAAAVTTEMEVVLS